MPRSSPSEQAYVTPSLIRWARERTHTSRDKLAKKLNTKVDAIESWEKGQSSPTMRQATRMAKVLYVPFGYLFLQSPPRQDVPLPDFRTHPSQGEPSMASAEFTDLLNDVLAKHTWYREFLQQEGSSLLPFVGSFRSSSDFEEVARSIAATLQIDASFRDGCSNWEDFLRAAIGKAEAAGILVMRSSVVAANPHRKISTKEFRGFAISDPVAPLIFINASDFKAAQIFTLAHELAHIWMGQSGVSNEDLAIREQPNRVEQFCNEVAAELLVPRREFIDRWVRADGIDRNIKRLVSHYRVSSLVVLRRAFDLGILDWSAYNSCYKRERDQFRERARKKTSGGDYYANLAARNSPTFTSTVVSAVREGRALYREAADLLNVKVSTIPKIAEHLSARQARE